MAVFSRSEAQQRADDIAVFRRELARLEAEGVLQLGAEQDAAVRQHQDSVLAALATSYDIDRTVQSRQLSMGMRIASLVGALALAASVFFLFRQFWGRFDVPLQVAVLLGAALLTLAATARVAQRDPRDFFTRLAATLAFACFVLDLWMLGQIFDITPSDRALLPWAAYALLLAYACDERLLQVAGLLCAMAWISARAGVWGGLYWLDFGQRPEDFLPAAAASFAVPLLIDHRRHPQFAQAYRVIGTLAFFLPVLVLANWGESSYLPFEHSLVEGGYQLLGFAGTAALAAWGVRRGWGEVVKVATTLFLVFFYTKCFQWWWDIMPKYLFFLVMSLTAILFLLVFRRLRQKGVP